jgi:hypothetical protein
LREAGKTQDADKSPQAFFKHFESPFSWFSGNYSGDFTVMNVRNKIDRGRGYF